MAFFCEVYYTNIVGDNMKKEKTVNVNIFILLICALLPAISIFISKATVIRPILWISAIILLSISIKIRSKLSLIKTMILALVFFGVSIVADGIVVYTFKRIPVFSYNIVSNENSIVYTSIGMKVWQCDKKNPKELIVDPFYNNGYMCNPEDITSIDSNAFLNAVIENHSEYHNKYVKITGKISRKAGQNAIEMRPYSTKEITMNGYVEFADNITLRIIFNNEKLLDDYDVYDEKTVVGVIKNIENNANKYIVYMYDSKVVSSINLNEYTITITSSKKCTTEPKQIFSNEKNNIYTYCIEDAVISYPENKYELPQALSSNKISIDDIYNGSEETEKSETDESIIYRFEEYSVLVCDQKLSKDIYIGKKNMKFSDVTCQLKVEQ